MDITSCLRPKLPAQIHHLLSYFGQRQPTAAALPSSPKLARYQKDLKNPRRHTYEGTPGGNCTYCKQTEYYHHGLVWRILWACKVVGA